MGRLIRLPVTGLDKWRFHRNAEMDSTDYLGDVFDRGRTAAMMAGVRFEQDLMRVLRGQAAQHYQGTVYMVRRPSVVQMRCAYRVELGGLTVVLRGIIDAIEGATVVDWKATTKPKIEKYFDCYQWRCYLAATGYDRFRYDVFELGPKRSAVPSFLEDVHPLALHRYPDMLDDVRRAVADWVDALLEFERAGWVQLSERYGIQPGARWYDFVKAHGKPVNARVAADELGVARWP